MISPDRQPLSSLSALILLMGTVCAHTPAPPRLLAAPLGPSTHSRLAGDEPAATAFIDVTLVAMVDEGERPHQTVVVRGDRIVSVGPLGEIEIPDDARRIEGRGQWLMPGLTDGHVHVWGEDELLLFVANGVTTVRNMWGAPLHFAMAERVAAGEIVGPNILTTGPIMDGVPPLWNGSLALDDVDAARVSVAEQKAAGYDLIKVYSRLSSDVYEAIVQASREAGLLVCGHVPDAVGLHHALAVGQDSIEHLTGFFEALRVADGASARDAAQLSLAQRWSLPQVSDAALHQIADEVAASGSWNCPTLLVYAKIVGVDEAHQLLAAPEMRYVSPSTRSTWDPGADFRTSQMTDDDYADLRATDLTRRRIVAALHEAGAPLLLGTDTPNPFVIPGFSIHEELALLVAAGLTPYEALSAGTREAARFLRDDRPVGTIAVGQAADLLLLAADPLADVAALRQRSGVMAAGRWYTEATLRAQLEQLALSYETPPDYLAPFSTAPDLGGPQARYEVRFNNDLLLAVERSAFSEDGRDVITQLGYDPSWQLSFEIVQHRGRGTDEQITATVQLAGGRGVASFERTAGVLRLTGTGLYDDLAIEQPLSDEVMISLPTLTTEGRLWELIAPLAVGESLTLPRLSVDLSQTVELSRTTLSVRRLDDLTVTTGAGDRLARAYGLSSSADDGSGAVESTLWMDAATGRPLGLEQAEQLGLITARQVE